MIWHERIYSHFCVEAFFVMKSKGLEFLRVNMCYYLFLTCKRFFYEALIHKKREMALAMKIFSNDSDTQESIVVDVAREEASIASNIFCV